ncbi:hypothetical protein DVDV_1400 [Desulfovibrio sp. DV]|uniref:hypothetical protein n=1 Tax=Desulfovibrio sp. DV TaxID=1844708 RepID=UPI00094B8A54|nr:hypothetical protein [Desulfovibrio sp. DV]OLN28835.1 hypothetical protein DVDV_1400 [Desulfovibrio sp. DV]
MKRLLCLLALIAFAATTMGCPGPRRHAPPPPGMPAPGQGPHQPGMPGPGQGPYQPGQAPPGPFQPPVAHP